MKVLLTTLNAKFIHKNLALRWLYVANTVHDVDLIEFTIKDKQDSIVERILAAHYDVVCFSCYIWNIEPTLEIIRKLKMNNNIRIVVGGPEVSFESEGLLEQGVDAISIGEGERSLWEYIDNPNREIVGILSKQYPNHQYAYVDLAVNETYPDPYFMAMDEADMSNRYLYFETSRGCPYRCEYCLSSTDNKVRMFSEEYVFKILNKIKHSSVKQVKLLDRTFNCDPKRALKIAKFMNEECSATFQFEVVAETISDELLDYFLHVADKQRFRFEVGVQSFNPKTLSAVNRIQDNAKLVSVIKQMVAAGCILHVDLIGGLPYEDIDSFKDSFNQLFELHAAELQCGILKLLKGTSLKRKSDLNEMIYSQKPPYDVLSTKWLSEADLEKINLVAYGVEKFYNDNKCRFTIDTLLKLGYIENAFDCFYELGKRLNVFNRKYYMHDLMHCVKDIVVDDELVDACLMRDYMALFKQKPKKLGLRQVSVERKKQCYDLLIKKGYFNQNELYNYGSVELYYDGVVCEQVIVYHANLAPTRFKVINEEVVKL